MWSIVFLILLFCSDKRLILVIFLLASIVQGIESYFDYKAKLSYQELITKNSENLNIILKNVVDNTYVKD